tara:strand:- start:3 stop:350 length:348 start_codon:yes stop_codon:yes gene_type:complete
MAQKRARKDPESGKATKAVGIRIDRGVLVEMQKLQETYNYPSLHAYMKECLDIGHTVFRGNSAEILNKMESIAMRFLPPDPNQEDMFQKKLLELRTATGEAVMDAHSKLEEKFRK